MIITSIRLRNIKSFIDGELRFARGINIIAGSNGAGKSTVIEAAGLALFDAWPQRFREGNARAGFLRNGTREGSIDVTLLRSGVTFTVHCDLAQRTRGGKASIDYERTLLDAQGGEIAKSAGRKKEFQEDLRRELLGEARIDDEKLFRDIIGTEQGAFDEPFTRIESERRQLFEKILGIEDFQDYEKQFHQLVKWQNGQARELAIRLGERAALPDELRDAESLLAAREAAAKEAALALKEIGGRTATARRAVDTLAEKRDALQSARSETARITEKLKGEEAAEANARGLRDEAAMAAVSLEAARAGHDAFIAAGKRLESLRQSAKSREATERMLAEETTGFEKMNTGLSTKMEAMRKEDNRIATEIGDREKIIKEINLRLELLRIEYRTLDEARRTADARAALATDLRSYVQDLRSTRDALQNAGEKMRSLHETFTSLAVRIEAEKLEASFIPELRTETEAMYARYPAEEGGAAEADALARMHDEAKRIEAQAKKAATQAADLASRKKEEGEGERKQLGLREKELEKLKTQRDDCTASLADLAGQLERLAEDWRMRATALRTTLDAHGDLDSMIAAEEILVEENREAHASFLAQQAVAAMLARREESLRIASAAVESTRILLSELAKELTALDAGFSEDEFVEAKSALDAVLAEENAATAAHGQAAAFESEQQGRVKELRREFRAYERLRAQAAQAKAEAAFIGEVHQHVVRELARSVGASIVSALSAFAAELYTRIAPEQDLALYWDAQTYAVELRGAQGTVRGRELSGGQLMGVSLAVKLALIKWYSQCRIGFLDEPTTHLDRETRRHLADVIQNLEQLTTDGDPWFDQLFVISHEESFAGAGHRIELVRDAVLGSVVLQ